MFDAVATQDAIDLLETLIADPELSDSARFILTRALNRLDHELRGELVPPAASDPTQTGLAS